MVAVRVLVLAVAVAGPTAGSVRVVGFQLKVVAGVDGETGDVGSGSSRLAVISVQSSASATL